jgi:hypothetical protein
VGEEQGRIALVAPLDDVEADAVGVDPPGAGGQLGARIGDGLGLDAPKLGDRRADP